MTRVALTGIGAWARGCAAICAVAGGVCASLVGATVGAQQPREARPAPSTQSGSPQQPREAPPATPPQSASAAQAGAPAIAAGVPIPAQEVVTHVSQTIAWYRRVVTLQQLPADPDDLLSRERLYQTALTSVRLAFDFGRAAAALEVQQGPPKTVQSEQAKPGQGGPAQQGPAQEAGNQGNSPQQAQQQTTQAPDSTSQAGALDRAAVRVAARVTELQTQLSALDEQIAHASGKARESLTAQRGEVSAELDLEKEIQATVAQIERFEESSDTYGGAGSGGLAAEISDLQRSVPEARHSANAARRITASGANSSGGASSGNGTAPAAGGSATSGANSGPGASPASSASAPDAPAPSAPPAQATFRPESAGVIALAGQWFSLTGTRRQLVDGLKQTDALLKEQDSVRGAVTQGARAIAHQSLAATGTTDPAQWVAARQQLEAAANRFRQLSTLLIPLGEEGITLESARNIALEWRNSVDARAASVARYLALRVTLLLGSVAVVLAISEIWRRATFRYLHDARRRQQFLALRKVAVGVALALVIIFGLVSEVGSVATYAGLITAGLAVALQNVILAVVAYFFLIGRYGVRVGDRITLAGVTGRVVDIGLVRIYLMELTGPELRSSGRMVVLSNAVIFQPTALFKQMPGGDFWWHTVTLTFAATADVQDVEKRLREAADSVYENYRPAIERQHAALQRFIDFETAMPRPEVYMRLTEKGLECTIRYPVEPAHAASIDQKMLAALREAQAKAPELQLVNGPILNANA